MRSFSFRLFLVLGAFLLLTGFAGERFLENTHYRLVPGGQATASPEVIEFFSYGCPHCRHVEPEFEKWLATKPANVKVTRIPAAWNQRFEVLARLYLALQEMGGAEKYSDAIFKAIHDDHKDLFSKETQIAFLQTLNVDTKRFGELYDSPKVNEQIQSSMQEFARYKISGVPGFIVNGKYFTDVTMGGHGGDLFDVINFLISKG